MILTYVLLAILFAAIVSQVTRVVIYTKLTNGELFISRGVVYKAMIILKNQNTEQVQPTRTVQVQPVEEESLK